MMRIGWRGASTAASKDCDLRQRCSAARSPQTWSLRQHFAGSQPATRVVKVSLTFRWDLLWGARALDPSITDSKVDSQALSQPCMPKV